MLELVDIIGVYPGVKSKVAFTQTLQHGTRLYNGQFIGNATGWTLNTTSWAYAATNKVARTKTADTDTLSQTALDILAGVPYSLRYTLSGTTSYGGIGTATIASGGTGFIAGPGNLITVTQAGAASGQLSCTADAGGVLISINSVSVIGTGYYLASALATVGGNNNATVNITVISGGGSITPMLGTVSGLTPRKADGTYTETITPTVTGGSLVFTPTSDKIATNISDVSLSPRFPRYTDGVGLRFFAMTSQVDNVPGANASNMQFEYRNQNGWPTYESVDSCDVTTNWTGSADATLSVNSTNFKSGVGSLNLRKTGTAAALITMIKDTTSVNMTGKKLTFWYYCVDATAYAKLAAAGALIVRFGNDSTHYYQWTFANTTLLNQSQIGAGWQQIECSLLNYTSKTANVVDLTAMDYTYIGLTATTTGTVWAAGDFMIDQIEVVPEASQLGATCNIGTLSLAGQIAHSGAAVGNFAPFLPMAAGDTGVQRIESVTIPTISTNEASLCIVVCKPIASIPLPYGFVAAERDFMSQLPSLPQIKDGACLGLILFTGAVTAVGTMYAGNLDIAWG